MDVFDLIVIGGGASGFMSSITAAENDVKNITKNGNSLFLDSGSPHHLEFVKDVSKINVNDEGANIRYGKTYLDEGTNVDFIELIDEKKIKIRTYAVSYTHLTLPTNC